MVARLFRGASLPTSLTSNPVATAISPAPPRRPRIFDT